MDLIRRVGIRVCATVAAALLAAACGGGGGGGGGGSGTIQTVVVSWTANPDTAVNRAGGGYRVYYSTINGFSITDPSASVVDVPYSSGAQSPTTTTLQLSSGVHYFRVVAYSSLNRPGSSGGSQSVTPFRR